MPILKLDQHDESLEIEFELRYLKSLTRNERFLLMQKKSKEMQELMRNCSEMSRVLTLSEASRDEQRFHTSTLV